MYVHFWSWSNKKSKIWFCLYFICIWQIETNVTILTNLNQGQFSPTSCNVEKWERMLKPSKVFNYDFDAKLYFLNKLDQSQLNQSHTLINI